MSSTGAVSSAAVDLADKLNAKAIVAYTQTGATVHRVSREPVSYTHLKGDVDKACYDKASAYTPNPGGVGPMTRAMLLANVVEMAERHA